MRGSPNKGDEPRLTVHTKYIYTQAYGRDCIHLGQPEGLGKSTKHGVSFEEAKTAFLDENARLMEDPDHSQEEDRFILLGLSARRRLLVVCHCYREDNDQIRIISARKANRPERRQYENFRHAR